MVDRRIVLTMLVCFALSLAFLYWRRVGQDAAPPTAAVGVSMPARQPDYGLESPDQPQPSHPAPSQFRWSAGATAAPTPPRAAAAPAEAAASAETPTEYLPVALQVWNRKHQNKIEGAIRNFSNLQLSITLHGRNAEKQETSQMQIELGPNEEMPFGTDEGMNLQEGDQVIAQAQGYLDKDTRVP